MQDVCVVSIYIISMPTIVCMYIISMPTILNDLGTNERGRLLRTVSYSYMNYLISLHWSDP